MAPSFAFLGPKLRWTLNSSPFLETSPTKSQKSHLACTCILRHISIFKDLSLFLAGSPQEADAEGIWTPCPQVRHLTREQICYNSPNTAWRGLCTFSCKPLWTFCKSYGLSLCKNKVIIKKPHQNTRHWVLFQGKLDGKVQDI